MITNEFNQKEYEVIEFHNEINGRIRVYPMYYQLGFSSVPSIYGRFSVLDKLLNALDFLPEEYGVIIWDVYRPRTVQAKLFDWMRDEIRVKSPELNEEDNYDVAKKYMSPPSAVGDTYCPPHLSGGAIDLTLYDMLSGKELDMGTSFDDCSLRAHTDYFTMKTPLTPEEDLIKQRRLFLRSAMNKAGFTSYEYEWWHFDIGNIFWSRVVNQPAVFGPLFGDEEWPQVIHHHPCVDFNG